VVSTDDHSSEEPAGDGPDIIAQYELLTKFATGGMAELFLARERGVAGLERVVVIKRLLPHLADDPDSVDMFLREARLVARLNHPNVVQTYELGAEGGEYFLAMEYIHGSTLRELQTLADEGDGGPPLPLPVSVSAIHQACRGLHAAHELRDFEGNLVELIHRDVSPQNLMVDDEGYVKLLDFGVAKAAEGEEATYSGNLKGKFSYMSPEQLHREPLDRRSDIFALGVVLWELVTGDRLYDRDGELETMQAITGETVPAPSTHNADIPDSLDMVVLRALEKDRDRRYQTVENLREDLVEVADRHDLLLDEPEIGDFVRGAAGDQLDARRAALRDALDRTLTDEERARLRHERSARASSNPDASAPGEASLGPDRSETSPRRAAGRSEAPAPTTASGEGAARDGESSRFRWQHGLFVAAMALLAASAALALFATDGERREGESPAAAGANPGSDVSGDPLVFGIAPIASENVLTSEFRPVELYLEHRVGRPIDLVVGETYETTSESLRNGDYDLAMLTPLLFVRTRRADSTIEPLAVREIQGSVSSDGLLLVRGRSDIHRLEQLRGRKFCFTDENSTTGNFFPRSYLRDQGFEPDEFIGAVHWSGDHLQVLRDLVAGDCDAAATYSGSYFTAHAHGVPVGKIRQLAITGHTPSETITATPDMSAELVAQLREALLAFDPRREVDAGYVGETLRLTGFREPRNELYESLETAVDQHADILEEFGFPGNPAEIAVPRSTDGGVRPDRIKRGEE